MQVTMFVLALIGRLSAWGEYLGRFRVQATLLMVRPHGITKFATNKEPRFKNYCWNT